jgi:hypothetical protein
MSRAPSGSRLSLVLAALLLGLQLAACKNGRKGPAPKQNTNAAISVPAPVAAEPGPHVSQVEMPAPAPLKDPVPLWEYGRTERFVDAATAAEQGYLVIDLGEAWTPYLFTEGSGRAGKALENSYRPTYLALARGEFPNDFHGERAKVDKYLELFGILPTLSVLRTRMIETAQRTCAESLDLGPLQSFFKLVTYSDGTAARKTAAQFASAEASALELMRAQGVSEPEALDKSQLAPNALSALARYLELLPQWRALDALQKRLQCEGFLAGKGKVLQGVMDWATHAALAEFERKNRVFSLGYLGKDSLTPLRRAPLEVDYDAALRILTERAMHAAGVLEDGTLDADEQAVFTTQAGLQQHVPNLSQQLRDALVAAFGIQSPETALGWLTSLGELPAGEHRYVAIRMIPLPEYYAPEMELTLDYDRGDVWYDFPYDDKGKEIPQPVSNRPQVTVSTLYNGQKIPLARFGTTIGGWRTESVESTVMWKYKESPVGERAWDEIVAAPVWLPPDTTPPEDLLMRNPARKLPSDPEYLVKYHETGPSYASAYGLVAAYHRTFARKASGRIALGNDEGIRTHGSVDYMSIMRRHSHGCHRLHNHLALRLMSFVLAHRPHDRLGQEAVSYQRLLSYKGQSYRMDIQQGGYVFRLKTPLIVNVLEGRIRGNVKEPIELAIPQFNQELRAYVMPDGTAVRVRGHQLVSAPLPPMAAREPARPVATKPAAQTLLARTMPPAARPNVSRVMAAAISGGRGSGAARGAMANARPPAAGARGVARISQNNARQAARPPLGAAARADAVRRAPSVSVPASARQN